MRGAAIKAAAAEAVTQRIANGPARNTCSKSNNILERALHSACFINTTSGNPKSLACKQYPKQMFLAVLVVMDIKWGKILKHQQLLNHPDPDTTQTW